ncbi:hypothetical protein BD779DRAFT_1491386 [Infundibulicybe gibba]|nr:hypothetical protein BD779DRAFT_1491386 [Infundibulicybe gibba]
MAPKASLAMLFHPKKNAKKEPVPTSPRKPSNNAARPKSTPDSEEEQLKLPDGPYQEFKLMSSALNGWKYDVMKFDSRKSVDISKWVPPIKLNRKEMRRDEAATDAVPEAVGPMLGPDGKPVIGADGKMVMVDVDGRPIHPSDGAGKGKAAAATANAKKRFQKKTRQVFYVPEEVRQLRREERYPWVMEDATQKEIWVGQMEEVSRSETHAFFMPAANDVFKFVPAHRWYKFQKKLKHDLPTDTANVESLYNLNQKRDPQAWLSSRNGKGPSAATAAMFKAEAEGRSMSGGSSLLGPGGRKLKTVDSGMSSLFDDDDDGDTKRRREKELGGEGDLDEQEYEADFADDEEKMDVDDNDEEAKEIEERLKREGTYDESDDEEVPGMTKQAKAMQKLIRNREGNDAYDSDEEKNPYASSEEEEEEEELPVSTEPAIQPQPQQVDSRANSQTPKPGTARPAGNACNQFSRNITGTFRRPRGGTSPVPSRATSPVVGAGSRAASPSASQKPNNKRKATDDPAGSPSGIPNGNGINPKPKKRKAPAPVASMTPAGELEDKMRCIQHFTPYLTDEAKKSKFTALVKEVAQLKGGILVLRNAYRGGSSAPSPAA